MTSTRGVAAATALTGTAEDRILSDAARALYEADYALHIARQSGVDSWVAAAYQHLHHAVGEYQVALAACQPVPPPPSGATTTNTASGPTGSCPAARTERNHDGIRELLRPGE